MMHMAPLTRAWIALLMLSGTATVVSLLSGAGLNQRIAGVLVVLLALAKARVILSRYLGLWQAQAILRGFTMALALFSLMVMGLYLAA